MWGFPLCISYKEGVDNMRFLLEMNLIKYNKIFLVYLIHNQLFSKPTYVLSLVTSIISLNGIRILGNFNLINNFLGLIPIPSVISKSSHI